MIIKGGNIVNEGRVFKGSIVIHDDYIVDIIEGDLQPEAYGDNTLDATGCYVLPGVIDEHVHFREPGLTEKADIRTESRAAAAGGVTSFFDMPNTVPQTTTLEALEEKFMLAHDNSWINYSFFFGATNDNYTLFDRLPLNRIPGIKLFMGSSTGNMLVDRDEVLERIFATTPLPLMAHCEDTAIINANMAAAKKQYGDDPDVRFHPLIRSEEACLSSTIKAISLAVQHQTRLHVAHVTTAEELSLFAPYTSQITAEATIGHLFFSLVDYQRLGSRIKVNPAIKNFRDCQALRDGLTDGHIAAVATDHAPHLLQQKQGGAAKAASGMPMIQFSLVTMLELVDQGVLTIERLVQLMCHQPAMLFDVSQRGFLRPGYKADITIVRPHSPWTVSADNILSKCGWSPMEGHCFDWRVEKTLCNGLLVYDNGQVSAIKAGQEIQFCHP